MPVADQVVTETLELSVIDAEEPARRTTAVVGRDGLSGSRLAAGVCLAAQEPMSQGMARAPAERCTLDQPGNPHRARHRRAAGG